MKRNEWITIIILIIVIAAIVAYITGAITGNVIKVPSYKWGTEVYTTGETYSKAEVDAKLSKIGSPSSFDKCEEYYKNAYLDLTNATRVAQNKALFNQYCREKTLPSSFRTIIISKAGESWEGLKQAWISLNDGGAQGGANASIDLRAEVVHPWANLVYIETGNLCVNLNGKIYRFVETNGTLVGKVASTCTG